LVMNLLNPYDDYSRAENNFLGRVFELIFDLGWMLWFFLLSPIGLVVAGLGCFCMDPGHRKLRDVTFKQ